MPNTNFHTPVLFLIFNRLDTTKKVFSAIRQAQPPRLYIASDGPRPDFLGEPEKVELVRNYVISHVNWNCEVKVLLREENLGCRIAVSTAIDWFFDHEPEGIILEDDCLPHPSFFPFCQELLNVYRDDCRISVISGQNVQFGRKRTSYSYYFSRYNHCWGWASWRRSWRNFDREMSLWPLVRDGNWLKDILRDKSVIKDWHRIFQDNYEGKRDSWAYRWTFSCWLQNQLSILSSVNMISNIGYGPDGTHTTASEDQQFSSIPALETFFPINHPPFLIRDCNADDYTQEIMYSSGLRRRVKSKIRKLKSKISHIIDL